MSEHDDPTDEHELYEEVPPRSIFAATWFRVVLVVIVIGVIGAVAIPYVLDCMNPPPSKPAVASKAPAAPTLIPERTATADKKDSTLIPAPASPSVPPPAAPAEPKPTPPTARPAEPKPATPRPDPKAAAATPEAKGKSAMAVTETAPAKPATKPDATTATPTAKPDASAKSDTSSKPDTSAKPEIVAKAETAKPAATKNDAKPAVAAKSAPTAKRAAATATAAKPPAASGPFWVQVGAFRDADTAKKVAAKLREDNFTVEETMTRTGGTPAAAPAAPKAAAPAKPDSGTDQYDVFVSGQTPDELNKRLAAKGLAAEASGNGMVVKPSLPLRDAVALSKDLAVEGFKVQVRRSGGPMSTAAPAAAPSAAAATAGGVELHRVRVGSFPDRATALAALKQLEAKGYKPYIARGNQ